MFSTGLSTIVFYLVSLTFFMFAMFYQSFFIMGIALGTLFFIVASIIIAIMVKKRINT